MGRLFLIPVPLGNVEDLAPRSRELIASLPVLFCEDTRTTSRLIAKLGLGAPSLSALHDHNERQRVASLCARLDEGDVGLVSEAGTPVLSDPGFLAVRGAIEAGHEVVSVPGPNAAVAAVVGSGLPVDRFVFAGFPPRSSAKRQAWLGPLVDRPETLVLYEAPRRIRGLLADLQEVAGDREVALAVNLSKQGERFVRGSASDVDAQLATEEEADGIHGEMTLVVAGAPEEEQGLDWSGADALIDLLLSAETPKSTIRDAVCLAFEDLPKRAVYQRILAR